MSSRFSQEIKTLLERITHQPLTLSDLLTETSERGFSLIIGLLVLPFLVPMPPGLSTVLGGGCLLLSVQMAMGRRSPWLPRRVAQFQFPRNLALQILNPLRRFSTWLERFTRPRLTGVTQHPRIWQVNGLCLTWLTLLLMSPIPMTNPLPTVGILAFVIATLEGDGLLLCISYGLTTIITGFFGVIVYLLWQSPALIQQWLGQS
ncbi:exopolysaccharide biosynthesis protein [Egbenema bharatensis]|uniref:exopolysaccharide biosynthesis protein n=1 Tax=Egbenema bharatensis TaxID=3463334 RepID=UPI003A8BE0AD